MVTSSATTPEQYLSELADDRRDVMLSLYEKINQALPDGYKSVMCYGMLSWVVPLEKTGPTYNGQPMAIISLASQKRNISLYLTPFYIDPVFKEKILTGYESISVKPNVGKSCIRFTKPDRIPLDLILQELAIWTPDYFIEKAEWARNNASCD